MQMSKKKTIKRFPRLIEGQRLGEVSKDEWKTPKLIIRIGEKGTDFVFQVPSFPRELKKKYPEYFQVMFAGARKRWKQELENSYKETIFDGRPIRLRIERLLYNVFLNALSHYLEETAQVLGQEYGSWIDGELKALKKEGGRERRKKLSEAERKSQEQQEEERAGRLSRRYSELLPEVREVRKFIKKVPDSKRKNLVALYRQVQVHFKYKWLRLIHKELEHKLLGRISSRKLEKFSLAMKDWAARDLTLGIIICEQKETDPSLKGGFRTIYRKYISGRVGSANNKKAQFKTTSRS